MSLVSEQQTDQLLDTCDDRMSEPLNLLWEALIPALIIMTLSLIVYEGIFRNSFHPLLYYAQTSQWARFIVRPSIIWGLMGSSLLLFRTFFTKLTL